MFVFESNNALILQNDFFRFFDEPAVCGIANHFVYYLQIDNDLSPNVSQIKCFTTGLAILFLAKYFPKVQFLCSEVGHV